MAKQDCNATTEDAQHPAQQGLTRKYSKDKSKCLVTFWLPKEAAPEARCVTVVGTFNNWDPKLHMMKKLESGDFGLRVELQAGKEYAFRYIIDETCWVNAWDADKYVWCDYGQCENSVIVT
jgi:1,4-alpha-glucan branching enzyme